ncbi:MAG: LacI family DNA-binding transcriptional regulator [Arachnia sp.]
MAATMQDVAKLAEVSVKTVSNVVNDYKHVTPATRERVRKAIEKLGYEVNLSARNLRTGRTGLITLALPELRLPYFAELAASVIAEAEQAGMRVLVEQTNADREREIELLQGRSRHMVDGVVFSPLALGQDDIRLFNVRFPLVLLGERVFGSPNDHVTMSNVEAAKAATHHLLARGCRRIAFVGSHPGEAVGSAALREQGYRAALAEAGIPVDERLVVEAEPWHRLTGATVMDRLLTDGTDFDGVFAANDSLALGVLHSLNVHRVPVPERIAVIGFDDVEDASFAHPTLTSVSPGREQIAREAVRLLMLRIAEAGMSLTETRPAQSIRADFEIMARESSARS